MEQPKTEEHTGTKQPLFSFGVIADVQYCDIDDAWNFTRTVKRRYRGALASLARAVDWYAGHYAAMAARMRLVTFVHAACGP